MDCLLCYHVLLMVFGSMAFVLLWTGYLTPGWLAVTFQEQEAFREYTVSSLNRSLWYDVLCPQELYSCKGCEIGESQRCVEDMAYVNYTSHYNWIEFLQEDHEHWVLWRVLMTISVVCCVIGFIFVAFLVCCRLKTSVYRIVATIAFFLWLIPAIFTWIPVAMDADMHEEIKDEVNDNIPHDSTLHLPYSLVLVAIGAFLALIVALMLLWLTGVCYCCNRDDRSERTSYTSTEDSKTRVIEREHVSYGPHMYPYYIQEQVNPTYVREVVQEPVVVQQRPIVVQEQRPVVVKEEGPMYYYREREPVHRPVEEVLVENPDIRQGRVLSVRDDRSEIYRERWYDNRSGIGLDRKY